LLTSPVIIHIHR